SEARGDPSPSLERLIRPHLIHPDHLLAGRALQPAADHARHADVAHDATRFELYLLHWMIGVTTAPARKFVRLDHDITVGCRWTWRRRRGCSPCIASAYPTSTSKRGS